MNIEHLKNKLIEEKNILEEEITLMGGVLVSNGDYSMRGEDGVGASENIELANSLESESNKEVVLNQLENRLIDVVRAMGKIESGTYGICEISGEQIEEARLKANPAARTNIANREAVL